MSASACHAPSVEGSGSPVNRGPRKPVDSARTMAGRRAAEWRPIPAVCEAVAYDFARGLDLRSIGKRYVGLGKDAIETILRDYVRAARRAGLAVSATACLLIGIAVRDVWEAGRGDEVAMERSFRKRGRSRKRGLEDGSCLIEMRVETPAAA